MSSTFICFTCGQLGHASTNCPWKEKIREMVRKKAQDHKVMGGFNEKKNEEATTNMVMVATTKSMAPKEVVFQYKEPFKGKEP